MERTNCHEKARGETKTGVIQSEPFVVFSEFRFRAFLCLFVAMKFRRFPEIPNTEDGHEKAGKDTKKTGQAPDEHAADRTVLFRAFLCLLWPWSPP